MVSKALGGFEGIIEIRLYTQLSTQIDLVFEMPLIIINTLNLNLGLYITQSSFLTVFMPHFLEKLRAMTL